MSPEWRAGSPCRHTRTCAPIRGARAGRSSPSRRPRGRVPSETGPHMSVPKRASWDAERIEEMKRRFDAGLSCSQIARELGVTRNAVLGKLHRLRLTRPRDLASAQSEQRRAARLKTPRPPSLKALNKTWLPRRVRMSIAAQHELLAQAFDAAVSPVEAVPIHNGRGCTLLELGSAHCRWPINNPGAADFCFCGNEPVKGLPYCAGHARIAYRPAGRSRAG